MKNCAVILAGGEGKRMKSDKPKTLSEVLDRKTDALLGYVGFKESRY